MSLHSTKLPQIHIIVEAIKFYYTDITCSSPAVLLGHFTLWNGSFLLTSLSPSMSSRAFSYSARLIQGRWYNQENHFEINFCPSVCLADCVRWLSIMHIERRGFGLRKVKGRHAKWDLLFSAWLYMSRMLLWVSPVPHICNVTNHVRFQNGWS